MKNPLVKIGDFWIRPSAVVSVYRYSLSTSSGVAVGMSSGDTLYVKNCYYPSEVLDNLFPPEEGGDE